MIILGIDPGFDRLGCAILNKEKGVNKIIYSTCFLSDRKLSYEKRILGLGEKIKKIITKYKPDVLAIEKLFFTKNKKTAMQIAEVRGMILYLASLYNLSVCEFTPPQIKITITGYGNADKTQVQKMLKQELKLKNLPKYDDESDAIGVAITASVYLSTARLNNLYK